VSPENTPQFNHHRIGAEQLAMHTSLDTRLVREIASYLKANQGPDEKGRAHHNRIKLPIAEATAAIEVVQSQGELLWLRPYHCVPAPTGCWEERRFIDEVLKRKCDTVLREYFDGDLTRFCCEVTQKHLLSPLIETHGGREIPVSMRAIGQTFNNSPYAMVRNYLRLIGRDTEYSWLKPYHMRKAPVGTWQEQTLIDEVLKKKCDSVLQECFDNDLTRFCCEVTAGHLLSSLIENHGGRDIPVSMIRLADRFDSSPYAMVRDYLRLLGRDSEFSWLKPYHMKMAGLGTWQEQTLIDEVLKKKCDSVVQDFFDNDLTRFCCEVTAGDLLSPLIETHGGRDVSVSMSAIGHTFGGSPYAMVRDYLRLLGRDSEYSWLKPYHMKMAGLGTWQEQTLIDEVLKKKCDRVVQDFFDNDLTRFCCEVTAGHLLSPLIETHGGKEISVGMGAIGNTFGGSPYAMVRHYLRLIYRDSEYSWFKPYHMKMAALGTWQEQTLIDEVLKKKCDSVVQDFFDNDLARFCCEVTAGHLLSPLIETHGGKEISVSMGAIGRTFDDSPYAIVRYYLRLICRDSEFSWLKPYHMARAALGTWQEQTLIDEVLKKKCDRVVRDFFDNDLTRFCCEVTAGHLLSPLIETHGGRDISVSMKAIGHTFDDSPYAMVRDYLRLLGRDREYAWLKPYHMTRSASGTWQEQTLIDEVLKKKCDGVVRDIFDNNLTRFCCEVTQKHLLSPLIETHGGRDISVSMGAIGSKFDNSPYPMVRHYLRLLGRDREYAWFQPYHMKIATLGTWQEQTLIDEVLKKKCDSVLRDLFDNDLTRFCCEVTQKHLLLSPLIETHGGRDISVSMSRLGYAFDGSTYAMVRHYHKLIGRSFSYTPECFIGPPETRKRRQSGELSARDLRWIRLPDGTLNTKRYGFKNFTAPDKTAVRQFMVEIIEDIVKDRSVHYLGLETEQFLSLRALYERVNLSPEDSLVVEQDTRTFKAMKATLKGLPNGEGRALREVDIRRNDIARELDLIPERSFQFNVVNLDYLGHFSEGKEYCLRLLLEKHLLHKEALVFVTLQDNELARNRAAAGGYSSDQASAVDMHLTRLANLTGHQAQRLAWLHYEGGSGGKISSQMLWLAYKVTREERSQPDGSLE
jgi:hypothetical protein